MGRLTNGPRYAVVCVAGGLGVLLLLPETKGKTLAEAHALLAENRCCPCACGKGAVGSLVGGSGGAALSVALSAAQHEPGGARDGEVQASEQEEHELVPALERRSSSALVLAI